MRSNRYFIYSILLLICQPVFAANNITLLLTSFDPFGGSGKNNTQEIIATLAKLAPEIGSNVIIKTCNLPVIYDTAAKSATACIASYHPDAVISFGEGYCSLQIESAATNWDSAYNYPDNAGQIRNGSRIRNNGPDRSGFLFPVETLFCHFDNSVPFTVSRDPGAFVCNNTAYHLSLDLKAQQIPYTFIHVPHSRCAMGGDVKTNVGVLVKMLRGVVLKLQDSQYKPVVLPGTREEAEKYLREVSGKGAAGCEIAYAQRLVKTY